METIVDNLKNTKKILGVLMMTIIVVLFIFFLRPIKAQDAREEALRNPSEMKAGQSWTCLNVPQNWKGDVEPPAVASLTGTGVCKANTKCYLVMAKFVSVPSVNRHGDEVNKWTGEMIYTTGTLEGDMTLFGKDNRSLFSEKMRLTRGGLASNSKEKIATGLFDVNAYEVEEAENDVAPGGVDVGFEVEGGVIHDMYSFYIAGANEEMGTGGGEIEEEVEDVDGNDNSQKLDSITIPTPVPPTVNVFEGEEKCVLISWDPYGYVFDSVSMEPIEDVVVTLFQKKDQADGSTSFDGKYKVVTPSGDNPAMTDIFGKYNILVNQSDYYYFDISAAGHDFVADSGYDKAKHAEIYGEKEENVLVFEKGTDPFFEKEGEPRRVDIPLKPKASPYVREKIGYIFEPASQTIEKNDGTYIKYDGQVDFPHAIIPFYHNDVPLKLKNGREVIAESNRLGLWSIEIKLDDLPDEVSRDTIIIKEPFKNPNLFPKAQSANPFLKFANKALSYLVGEVKAAETDTEGKKEYELNSIPRYLEGYAYDKNGNALPKAQVEIRLKMNDKLAHSTKSDDSGFFTIYKNNLPPLPYYIKIIPANWGAPIILSTNEFIKSNRTYLESQKINILTGEKEGQPIVDAATDKLREPNPKEKGSSRSTGVNKTTNQGNTQTAGKIALFVFILIVLMLAIVAVFIYILKRKNVTG